MRAAGRDERSIVYAAAQDFIEDNLDRNGTWARINHKEFPEGKRVLVCIDDGSGQRNHSWMQRGGNLWFFDDGTYAYWRPTHFLVQSA